MTLLDRFLNVFRKRVPDFKEPIIISDTGKFFEDGYDDGALLFSDLTELLYDTERPTIMRSDASALLTWNTPSGSIEIEVRFDAVLTTRVVAHLPNERLTPFNAPMLGCPMPRDLARMIAEVGDAIHEGERDPWDDDSDYGYADRNFVGEDTFEDEGGMARLLKQTKLPSSWVLVKVVNFTERSLKEQIAWLDKNCEGAFKRVGWSSNCSTKVAIGFSDPEDAILYRLRWR